MVVFKVQLVCRFSYFKEERFIFWISISTFECLKSNQSLGKHGIRRERGGREKVQTIIIREWIFMFVGASKERKENKKGFGFFNFGSRLVHEPGRPAFAFLVMRC